MCTDAKLLAVIRPLGFVQHSLKRYFSKSDYLVGEVTAAKTRREASYFCRGLRVGGGLVYPRAMDAQVGLSVIDERLSACMRVLLETMPRNNGGRWVRMGQKPAFTTKR